jgi:hypothetical protein
VPVESGQILPEKDGTVPRREILNYLAALRFIAEERER